MSLTDDLADLVAALPPSAIDALCNGLEGRKVDLSTSSFGFARLRGIGDDHATRIAGAFQRLTRASSETSMNEWAVATALRVANRLRSIERLTKPEIEIAWTGPSAAGPLSVRPPLSWKTCLKVYEMSERFYSSAMR